MRPPTYRELRRFIEVEGWTDKDAAAGRATGDHHRYVFTTPMGDRLYTRISHGRGKIQDADLFRHILRDQLHIEEDQFWAAVDRGKTPERPEPLGSVRAQGAIDAKLARSLLRKVGISPVELSMMTQEDAVARWSEWLAHGAD
jgi:hypothetical protein